MRFIQEDKEYKKMTMIEKAKAELASIEEAIEYEKLNDRAYTKWFTYLLRQRKLLKKFIKQYGKIEDQKTESSEKFAKNFKFYPEIEKKAEV